MLRVAIFLWFAPFIAVWPIFVLPAWALGLISLKHVARAPMQSASVCAFVFLVADHPAWWWRLWRGWGGLSLPLAVLTVRDDPRIIRHELRHQLQWWLLGALFPVAYLLCGLWARLRGKSFYRDNALEVDARKHQDDV